MNKIFKEYPKNKTGFFVIIIIVISFVAGFFTHTLIGVKRDEYNSLLLYCDMLFEKTKNLDERISHITTDEIPESETSKTTITKTTEISDEYVWITKSGNKYHKANCSSLKKNSENITLSQAQQSGKEPCKLCFE